MQAGALCNCAVREEAPTVKADDALQMRLNEEADRLKRKAHDMPPCGELSMILGKAKQIQEAAEITDFLATPLPHEAAELFLPDTLDRCHLPAFRRLP